jgi:chromosome segregation ATPase
MAITLPESSIRSIMEQWVEASRLRLAGEQHSTTIESADVLVDELNRLRDEFGAVAGQRDELQLALRRREQELSAAHAELADLQRRHDAALTAAAPIASAGRSAVSPTMRFDEQWYLEKYPGVWDAVRRGIFASADEHY